MKTAIILTLCTLSIFAQGSRESDSLALVDLMEHNPDHTLNWDIAAPLDEWEGLWIHEDRVRGVRIKEKNISVLPESFGDMDKIEMLDISHNSISDLPQSLGNLWQEPFYEAGGFYAQHNTISSLPSSMKQAEYLERIELSHNECTEIPPQLSYIDSLSELYISSNNITSIPYDDMQEFGKLHILDISFNALTSFDAEEGTFDNMKYLHLSGNMNIDLPRTLTNLSNCPGLTNLYLDSINMETLPQELFSLRDLTRLSLAGNSLSQIPPEISLMAMLSNLNLSHNQLSDLPAEFEYMNNVKSLDLAHNNFSVLPEQLKFLSDISTLNLYYNELENLPDFITDFSPWRFNIDSNYLKIENLTPDVIIWLYEQAPEWRENQRTKTAGIDHAIQHHTGPLLRPSAKGIGIAGNIPHNTVLNLYSPSGRMVFSAPVGEAGSIPLPALSPGVYSAQLQAKGRGIAAALIRIE